MKKNIKIILLFLSVISLFIVGCSADKSEKDNESSNKGPSVMLLIPGSLGDKSFFDSANSGLEQIKEKYNCKTEVIEMGLDQTKFIPTFEDVIDEDWDIIITGGQQIAASLAEVAEEYPEQEFILYDESLDYEAGNYSNVYSMTYKQNEGAYLAGILAALVTTSEDMDRSNGNKKVGFVGGFDIPLINDHLIGLIQGINEIDSDVKIATGYTNSFTDASKGKETALNLFDSGIDIVYQAAGGAGLGALDAAKEAKSYAIGTDSDQAKLFESDEDKANAILTSMMKRVDISIDLVIDRYMKDDIPFGEAESFGISENTIELVNNEWYENNVSDDIRNIVSEYREKIANGEIEVKNISDVSESEFNEMKKQAEF